MPVPKHIHFLGIGGSGMSAVAQIAVAQGYTVSGCDLQSSTPYLEELKQALKIKNYDLKIQVGHSPSHLEGVDILAVSPAVFYQNDHHPEIELARQKGILIKWQDFMGTYLHSGKFVICVAGTHGKSTTTALAGYLLEQAGLDPTVEVGAEVTAWHNNVRLPAQAGLGQSQYFVSEADEFHDNFHTYHPDILILNNLEMDHPEYFGTFENLVRSFVRFVSQIKPGGTLIYNANSSGIRDVLNALTPDVKNRLNIVSYNFNSCKNVVLTTSSTDFTYKNSAYSLSLPGHHNIENALGIIELGNCLHLSYQDVFQSLKSFSGLGRRLELIGEKHGIKIFDDYANHPSAFKATIQAAKQLTNNSPLWVIIEPHTYSRLRAVLTELPKSLASADHLIISKIFPSRETDPGDFSGADIAAAAQHPDCHYIPEFPDIIKYLKSQLTTNNLPPTTILVMGSGLSYQLSRQILSSL